MKKLAILLSLTASPALAASGPFFSLRNTDFVVTIAFLIFIGILVYYKVPQIIGCDPSPLDMEHFAMACDMLFAAVPSDPDVLAEMLATPHDGPRFLEIQVR